MEITGFTSEELSQATHTVLRSWHSGGHEELPWYNMLIVRQRLAEQPSPRLELAVKEVLLQALNDLEQRAGNDAAQILHLRFLDALTAAATANRLNLTENIVYKQQRGAIQDLAAIVGRMESDARSAKAAQVLERLEIQEPPPLFGIDDKLAALLSSLTTPGPPWLVAAVGIGGIGKTSLADAAVRQIAGTPAFADIAWTSARQSRFTFWNGLQENLPDRPALNLEGLWNAIIEQLNFQDLARSTLAQRRTGVRARLKTQPYLIVVDNLETATDYRDLVPGLQDLVNPTKFLLTCRHSLHDHPGVHGLSLDELSETDSLVLLRHEARERGLDHIVTASDDSLLRVYDVAGGNPLAIKLLVGLMHSLPLPQLLDDLRQARGQPVEELYRHIYWRAWHLLDQDAQQVLAIMPMVAEAGGGLAQIAAVSQVPGERLTTTLRQLLTLSLINVRGPIEARRYSIHRLTETFLLNEVIKWQKIS